MWPPEPETSVVSPAVTGTLHEEFLIQRADELFDGELESGIGHHYRGW